MRVDTCINKVKDGSFDGVSEALPSFSMSVTTYPLKETTFDCLVVAANLTFFYAFPKYSWTVNFENFIWVRRKTV